MFLIVMFLVGLLAMFALEDKPKKKQKNLRNTQPFSDLRRIVDEGTFRYEKGAGTCDLTLMKPTGDMQTGYMHRRSA
ncbi:MAG: hypothetical protein IJH52_08910 [Oscillospiraceae bacterium]|nr:hypothetical protein [Oscillospiraceae bacterium]MBQ6402878.1 hypothetical protein [Oscillospiraceae bacterium]